MVLLALVPVLSDANAQAEAAAAPDAAEPPEGRRERLGHIIARQLGEVVEPQLKAELGRILTALGSETESVETLETAHRMAWAGHHYRAGEHFVRSKKPASATQHLEQALRYQPEFLAARLLLANVYNEAAQWTEAARVMTQGIPYAINDFQYVAAAFYILERVHNETELHKAALFLSRKGQDPNIRFLAAVTTARLFAERGQFPKSIAIIQRHHLLEKPLGLRILATVAWNDGVPHQCIELLKRGVAQFPDKGPFLAELARRQIQIGLYRQAAATIDELVSVGGHRVPAGALRGELLAGLGQHEQARSQLMETLPLTRTGADILRLANAAAEMGYADGIRRLAAGAKVDNLDVGALRLLEVEAYIRDGTFAKALHRLQTLAENDQIAEVDRPHALLLTAVAEAAEGRSDSATSTLSALPLQRIDADAIVQAVNTLESVEAVDARKALLDHYLDSYPEDERMQRLAAKP